MLQVGLTNNWVRRLAYHYGFWLCGQYPQKPALHKRIEAHAPFFERIDATYESRGEAADPAGLTSWEPAYMRKYLLASRFTLQWLHSQPNSNQRAQAAGQAANTEALVKLLSCGVPHLLMNYAKALESQGVADRTRRLYLATARGVCNYAGATQTRPLAQSDVDAYLRLNPGSRGNLGRFVRWLRIHTGIQLELPLHRRSAIPAYAKQFASLMRQIESDTLQHAAAEDLRSAIEIALGLKTGEAESLDLASVAVIAEGAGRPTPNIRLTLADGEIEVPSKLRPIVMEYARRRTSS